MVVAFGRPLKIRAAPFAAKCSGQPLLRSQAQRIVVVARSSQLSAAAAFSSDEAWQWLLEYTKLDFQGKAQQLRDSKPQRDTMREALQCVMAEPNAEAGWSPQTPEILLGVLSSDVRLGLRALRDWTDTVNADYVIPEVRIAGCSSLPQVSGSVFIKYNLQSKSCYVSQYQGQDRGVLITLGMQQFGFFPLGLFDEGMDQPAPILGAPSPS